MSSALFIRWILLTVLVSALAMFAAYAQKQLQEDSIKTSGGDLKITFIGHGTLMLTYAGKVIHADPVSMYADYATLPKADLILITHEHGDHLDMKAIQAVSKANTSIVVKYRGRQDCSQRNCFEKWRRKNNLRHQDRGRAGL